MVWNGSNARYASIAPFCSGASAVPTPPTPIHVAWSGSSPAVVNSDRKMISVLEPRWITPSFLPTRLFIAWA